MSTPPPQINRLTIEALLDTYAAGLRDRRLMLVHGRYPDTAPDIFTAKIGGEPRRVHVSDQTSVLGIVDAWQQHRSDRARDADVLVVTTGIGDEQLGWDVRGHAVKRRTLTVEKAEIVKQRFGVRELDSRLYGEPWLLEALLDAEPHDGWPRSGSLLTRDAAVKALVVARLGLDRVVDGETTAGLAIDADAMLVWSRTSAGPTRFLELDAVERGKIKEWLGETAGAAVPVLMSLVEDGRGQDAMARGLLAAAMADPATGPDTVLAVGGLFGQVRRSDILAFSDAVAGTLTRWIGEARHNEAAKQRVFSVIDRADRLAQEAGLTQALRGSRFLLTSFTAQLRAVAEALAASPDQAEAALADLREHALAALNTDRIAVAEMAVRVARWLSTEQPRVESVASGVRGHLAEWGWVDRALNVLWSGDPVGDVVAGQAYRTLHDTARARRDTLDEQFSQRLAGWTRTADQQNPGGCLLVENVLTECAARLYSESTSPLILLIDGMSSAAAVQLGEEAEREGWIEAVPAPPAGQSAQRSAAVSMLPSVTRISRTSLLTGMAGTGGQSKETAGFAQFWEQRRAVGVLFHKATIGGPSGHRLTEELASALASTAVVGVVLNTIDDALDHGQQGERTQWRINDITFMRELLAAAKGYGRPVLLVADHGHVLERGVNPGPAKASGAESSRWRSGSSAEDGEIILSGPRVLEGGGTIIAPWREDIRYTPRKAGYHGGASLAEVTVPLLVLLPALDVLPKGWEVLPREEATPSWWSQSRMPEETWPESVTLPAAAPVTKPRTTRKRAEQEGEGLFTPAEVEREPSKSQPPPAPTTLGALVVAGDVYAAQAEYVRRKPERPVVAAVIDALAEAGETMSPAALAAAISASDRVRRNMDGFIATLQRLLNVEGYPVLGLIDSGHTVRLDVHLLRTQFQLEKRRT
ncbi:BREX-2 system phosphatase PglZ [Streptomyces sp. SID12488]|uniref:BREX-2 system phosphatase PglZ n=1 Tax=Streptomyces sp. SID12488 TaxID=2706040 RepID=UPI0013DBD6DB|nr:BREX-2 system phosphatase PglZ [Streptomyces sp. SID12488]NEA62029.1 BREX-2 system phosphatase PglZ [Streptomyces sp. SID12488]